MCWLIVGGQGGARLYSPSFIPAKPFWGCCIFPPKDQAAIFTQFLHLQVPGTSCSHYHLRLLGTNRFLLSVLLFLFSLQPTHIFVTNLFMKLSSDGPSVGMLSMFCWQPGWLLGRDSNRERHNDRGKGKRGNQNILCGYFGGTKIQAVFVKALCLCFCFESFLIFLYLARV